MRERDKKLYCTVVTKKIFIYTNNHHNHTYEPILRYLNESHSWKQKKTQKYFFHHPQNANSRFFYRKPIHLYLSFAPLSFDSQPPMGHIYIYTYKSSSSSMSSFTQTHDTSSECVWCELCLYLCIMRDPIVLRDEVFFFVFISTPENVCHIHATRSDTTSQHILQLNAYIDYATEEHTIGRWVERRGTSN